MQASNEIIFDVDVLPEHIAWSPLYRRIFGFEPFGKLASESAPPLKSEADKNIDVISAFIHKIIAEKRSGSEELLLSYAMASSTGSGSGLTASSKRNSDPPGRQAG